MVPVRSASARLSGLFILVMANTRSAIPRAVKTKNAPSPRRTSIETQKGQMNAWTVDLAGGLPEGAPIRLAAEMARVVDDGPNLHVLPIVTKGATENLNSLL